ncbi:hypothetical protein HPB50_020507 [Hyalomma asiaticum]|uniref:Uncharacterized protein n=1 Tax=Hyalomma asiaticum TaxID=266040 RepID=A0ACB7RKM8_HYAAI|nr:hypothetical protein HPB50_020507 [Hyalomma asiaticum]
MRCRIERTHGSADFQLYGGLLCAVVGVAVVLHPVITPVTNTDASAKKRLQRQHAGGPKNESPSTSPPEQDGAGSGFCGKTTRCELTQRLAEQVSRGPLSSREGRRGASETRRAGRAPSRMRSDAFPRMRSLAMTVECSGDAVEGQ